MISGTVKFSSSEIGDGFIALGSGDNFALVHISPVERAGMQTLHKDQRVTYELQTDRRSKTSASNLQGA
ncbi:cold-shock protein [Sphingomonas sp. DT-51]|uniref:cold-shock protein n=1 Tax=Sphingomonas sp. DT-51 TaxID=3396165 RepID=UPI003F1C24DF